MQSICVTDVTDINVTTTVVAKLMIAGRHDGLEFLFILSYVFEITTPIALALWTCGFGRVANLQCRRLL